MPDVYVSTHWHVANGREDEFVELWRDSLTWTKDNFAPSFERARLLRDDKDPAHLVSFLEWDDRDGLDRWGSDPEKARRQDALEKLCTDVHGSTYDEATRVG